MAKREIKTTLALDGEQRYKQELKSATRELGVMKSETRAVTIAYGDQSRGVEALTERNKLLSKQADQQREIVESLTKAVDESAEKYGEADQRTDGYRIKLNNAKSALSAMENEIKRNNKSIAEQTDKWKKFGESAEKTGKKMQSAGKHMSSVGTKIAASVMGAAAAIGKLTIDTAAYADEILTLSDQTGVGTDELQKFNYAAELVDVSVDTMTKSMARNVRSMGDAQRGLANAVEAYDKLDVSVMNADGSLRNSQDVYWDVIDALGDMENEAERDSAAMQLMGRSAQELNPLIKAGSDRLKELGEEAEEAGYVMSGETLKSFGELDDQIQHLKNTTTVAKQELALAALPLITKATESLTGTVRNFAEWVSNLSDEEQENIAKMAAWVGGSGLALVAAGKLTVGVGNLVSTLGRASKAISAAGGINAAIGAMGTKLGALAAAAGPIALVGVALAGLGIAIKKHRDHIKELTVDARELDDAMAETRKTFDDSNEAFEKTSGEVMAAAEVAGDYIDRLEELEKAGLNTAEAQREYKGIVEHLQTLLPDINIELDEQTGLIKGGTDVLRESTEAWKENAIAQALQEQVKEQIEGHTKALVELTRSKQEYAKTEDEMNRLLSDQKGIVEKLSREIGYSEEKTERLLRYSGHQFQGGAFGSAARELYYDYHDLRLEIKDTNVSLDAHAESIVDAEKDVSELGEELEGTEAAAKELSDQLGDTTATEEAKEAIEELTKAEAEAAEQAEKMADITQNAFDRIEGKTELTVQEMIENLEHNQKAVREWSQNLALLAERGVDQGLLQELRDAGPEAAATVANMVDATDEELEKLSDVFRDGAQVAVDGAHEVGKATGEGFADGIDSKERDVRNAAHRLASVADRQLRYTLQIKSPSRKAEEVGDFYVDGLVGALDAGRQRVQQAASTLMGNVDTPTYTRQVTHQVSAPKIEIGRMEVRKESDIRKVAHELYVLQRSREHAQGRGLA